jgi:hypothetical protein
MSTTDTVYILGAGASVVTGAPVLQNFFPHVYKVYRDDQRVKRVFKFLRSFYNIGDDISKADLPKYETALSMIHLALENGCALDADYQEKELLAIRDDLLYLLWLVLEDTTSGDKPDELHLKFVETRLNPSDTVISLNYDLLIDHAISYKYHQVNYGVGFKELISSEAIPPVSNWKSLPLLLKLHGSLNWLFCPVCQCSYLYMGKKAVERIFVEQAELCPYDGTYLKGVLVPPTWIKNYKNLFLSQLWMMAEEKLRHAKKVVFIGYSLSEADIQVVFTFCKALHNNKLNPVIEVVNPEQRDTIHRRYRRLFGDVDYRQVTFADWV